MRAGLLAIAQHRQACRILARQSVCSDCACCGRANCRDFAGVQDAHRRAALAVKQHDEALVRLHALGEVLRKHADQLRAERLAFAEPARHRTEQTLAAERQDGAQKLPGLAPGEGDHGLAHDRDADLIGKAAADLVPVDIAHGPSYASRPDLRSMREAELSCGPRFQRPGGVGKPHASTPARPPDHADGNRSRP